MASGQQTLLWIPAFAGKTIVGRKCRTIPPMCRFNSIYKTGPRLDLHSRESIQQLTPSGGLDNMLFDGLARPSSSGSGTQGLFKDRSS